ncbi:unnamed protein product, partial [Didymodactylos carnosus]
MNRPRTSALIYHQTQAIKPKYGASFPQNRSFSACSMRSPSPLQIRLQKAKPWQRIFDGDKQSVYSQQGFQLLRNKQNVDAVISNDFFNMKEETSFDDSIQHSLLPSPIQVHIDQLLEQIDDLTLLFEEERLNHKQTRQKAGENLINQFRSQNDKYNNIINQMLIEHENVLEDLRSKHAKEIIKEQDKADARERHIQSEIDYVKNSFHTYKITMDKENEEKLRLKD